jgi:hypothetical protein
VGAAYLEILLNLLNKHLQRLTRLDPCGIEEDDFEIFALGELLDLLQHAGDGREIVEVETEGVHFDVGRGFGYEGGVGGRETLLVTCQEDHVGEPIAGKGAGDVIADAGAGAEDDDRAGGRHCCGEKGSRLNSS